jgi:hypothetical protein
MTDSSSVADTNTRGLDNPMGDDNLDEDGAFDAMLDGSDLVEAETKADGATSAQKQARKRTKTGCLSKFRDLSYDKT